jgi:hypothetical protein
MLRVEHRAPFHARRNELSRELGQRLPLGRGPLDIASGQCERTVFIVAVGRDRAEKVRRHDAAEPGSSHGGWAKHSSLVSCLTLEIGHFPQDRRVFCRVAVALALLALVAPLAAQPVQGAPIPVPLPLFPQNNWWNIDISNAPVDATLTTTYINFIGPAVGMHPDFGGDAGDGDVYGFPYIIVDGTQPKLTVDFVEYGHQSDGENHDTGESFPFYPVPSEAITMNGWVEGGQPGNVDQGGDRHILIVDKTNNHLYELITRSTTARSGGGIGRVLRHEHEQPAARGWTSADASGMAILPGLVRYDEVFAPDEIRHAFRMTTRATNGYVWPASHVAGSTTNAPPLGTRLRLKPETDISGFTPELQKIFRAMKKYGLIVADNGTDMYVSGVYDTRWDNDVLNPAFDALEAGDFEVIQAGWHPPVTLVLTLPDSMGAGDAESATLTAYDSNYDVATSYTGTINFTSTDGSATLPPNYTFLPSDNGTHTFTNGFTLQTQGMQSVTAADTGNANITITRGVAVGPPKPTGLSATATSGSRCRSRGTHRRARRRMSSCAAPRIPSLSRARAPSTTRSPQARPSVQSPRGRCVMRRFAVHRSRSGDDDHLHGRSTRFASDGRQAVHLTHWTGGERDAPQAGLSTASYTIRVPPA